jgi:hypothetical protein
MTSGAVPHRCSVIANGLSLPRCQSPFATDPSSTPTTLHRRAASRRSPTIHRHRQRPFQAMLRAAVPSSSPTALPGDAASRCSIVIANDLSWRCCEPLFHRHRQRPFLAMLRAAVPSSSIQRLFIAALSAVVTL